MKVLLIVAFLAFVAIANADAQFSQFMQFTTKFNKTYASPEEFAFRFQVFQQTLVRIENYRLQHFEATGESGEGVYGITKFADLTAEEFKARYLGYKPSGKPRTAPVVRAATNVEAPSSFDWRDKGAISPVKNQADCGSCWAFSATETIESFNFLAGNPLQTLSVQQIVSCDTTDGGCNGGDTITAYEYVESVNGLESDSNYPYTSGGGNNGNCEANTSLEIIGVSNYTYAVAPCTGTCKNQDLNTLTANVATIGPASICVYAEPWQVYVGGILSSGCSSDYNDLDHCVQLTGYNDEGATPYWIIRNSWAADWGIDGYIWVKKEGNVCGVADEATFVTTKRA